VSGVERARCAGALFGRAHAGGGGRLGKGVFSPESNDRDIAEHADRTNQQVVYELERGMTEAGPVIAGADGVLDAVAVAVGEGARGGRTGCVGGGGRVRGRRAARRAAPPRPYDPGARPPAPARFIGDAVTLVRLYAGRPVEGRAYELAGVEAKELNIFG
jgi:hypothetical protein